MKHRIDLLAQKLFPTCRDYLLFRYEIGEDAYSGIKNTLSAVEVEYFEVIGPKETENAYLSSYYRAGGGCPESRHYCKVAFEFRNAGFEKMRAAEVSLERALLLEDILWTRDLHTRYYESSRTDRALIRRDIEALWDGGVWSRFRGVVAASHFPVDRQRKLARIVRACRAIHGNHDDFSWTDRTSWF